MRIFDHAGLCRPPLRPSASIPRGLGVAAATLVALAAAACSGKAHRLSPPVPVTVAPVVSEDAPYVVTANGVVEPMQTVAVEAQVSGIITSVNFHEGDDVAAGQPLFHIDPRPYQAALEQAEATLAKDQAQAENSERDAQRYAKLVKQDYVTQAQADQAQATAAAQKATVQADSAAVAQARLNLGYTVIRAPIAGRTGSLLIHEGNLAKAQGSPLVVINQIRPILVRFPVPARQFPDVQEYAAGKDLPVTVTASEGEQRDPIIGRLTFVDNAVDPQTGTVMLKARFANGTSRLWPGEYVTANLQLYVQHHAIVIPSAAVVQTQNGSLVFVVDSSDVAHQEEVTVARPLDDHVIISAGLKAGERVVTDGQSRLADGDKVQIRTAPAVAPAESEGGSTP